MDIKNLVIGALTGLMVLFGGLYVMRPTVEITKDTPAPAQSYGSLAGPDIPSVYLRWGGVATFAGAQYALTQGASTTCAIQAPAATSTLQAAQIRFDLASTAAATVEIGKANDAFSTTTLIGTTFNIAAGAQAFIQASTSPSGPGVVFAPNQYVVFKLGGGGTGSVPTGTCQAHFISS